MIDKRLLIAGIILAIVYLGLTAVALPSTGLVWDETRYIAAAKARAYSMYAGLTGNPQLDMCSITMVPTGDDIGRCWDGRPRLTQTISGPAWAMLWFLSGQNFDVLTSVTAHRIPIILLTAIGIFAIFIFASEAFSRKVGLFSALALIFIPRFFAHSHYVTLDVTAAILILITTYFFWKGLRSWKFGLLTGVTFGLALASKVYAYALVLIIPLWIIISYRDRLRSLLGSLRKGKIDRRYLVVILSFLLIAPIILYLAWPWLWYDTANRFLEYVGLYTRQIEVLHVHTFYMGTVYDVLPWHYPWVMMLLTLPVPILILAVAGFLSGLKDTIRLRNRTSLLIILAAIIPIAIFSTPIAYPHNGVRLFLTAFPFIAIMAGIGAERLSIRLEKRFPKRSLVIIVLIAMFISIPGLIASLQGGVHSATYYNELAGGQLGAFNSGYLLDYYGVSYLSMIYWMNQNLPRNSSVYVQWAENIFNTYRYGDIGQIFEIAGEGREGLNLNESVIGQFRGIEQQALLREDIAIAGSLEDSDYFVTLSLYNYMTQPDLDYYSNCEPLHSVDVSGAPASVIYETDCL